MANTPKLKVTELDFDNIKENLKTFMKNQNEFTDYNFDGSGLSHIIDLLAYNTHYLAMNANMALNETYLDTATLRSSVVSHAKTLGYTPRSVRAPVAYLDIVVNNPNLTSLTMPKGTKFTTQVDGSNYGFMTIEDYTAYPSNGVLRFSNIPVYEGTRIIAKYTVDNSNLEKRYLLTDARADTTTLKVSVQNSDSDTTTTTFELVEDITQIGATTNAYFLQEVEDGRFEVYFGDDVIGKKLSDGNIVTLEYVVTNMEEANGASSFSSNSIAGETNVQITTLVRAQGGAPAESTESIRLKAPLDYSSQGRAVTTQDYKVIVPKVYADTKAIQVWGGEDNDPPIYGQVFLSIKTNSGVNLTQAQKNTISTQMKRYNIASVRPTFVDPEITKLILTVNFKVDTKSTTKSIGDLESLVNQVIIDYNSSDLEKFDVVYRHSKLTRLIDNADPSILSNITTNKMAQEFIPQLNEETQYVLKFNNTIFHPEEGHSSVIVSSGFTIVGNDNQLFFDDDGFGNVRTFYLVGGVTKTYVNETAGTINYSTGEITITSITISGTSRTDGKIQIDVIPNSNDIVSVRNQLLEIDTANLSITGEVDTIASGGSTAGTGYRTTQAQA
jgi:hypothetical protein